MEIYTAKLTGAALVLILGIAGCDVEQAEEGSLPDVGATYEEGQMPNYDVEVTKTQEGKMPNVDVDVEGGNLPAYDVETATTSVDSKEVDVAVPDVDVEMKDKTVSVPDVDVTMPGEDDEEEDGE